MDIIFLLHGDARSHNFSCQAPFFNLTPYAEREKKSSAIFGFTRRQESNLSPSADTAAATARATALTVVFMSTKTYEAKLTDNFLPNYNISEYEPSMFVLF